MNPSEPIQSFDEHDFFRRIVEEHQAAIRAFAAARIGDPFEAHDIAATYSAEARALFCGDGRRVFGPENRDTVGRSA